MEVYGMSRIHGRAPLIDNDATQGRAMNSIQTQASILAVDDDTRSLMALQGLLADMSLRVVTAKSGDEALRCVLKRSEEHTSELQSRFDLVCRLLLEKKN